MLKRAILFLLLMMPLQIRAEFYIGYFNHPQIEIYKHLVGQAYADIGIAVKFVEVTMERGLLALDEGLLDADVIRAVHAKHAYENIVIASEALTTAQTHLICQPNVVCDTSVFNNTRNDIYINLAAPYLLEDQVGVPVLANQVVYDKVDTLLSLMLDKRIVYVIYHSDESGLPPVVSQRLQSKKLAEYDTYHVIHTKNVELKAKLQKALSIRMRQMREARLLPESVVNPS